MQVFKMKEDFGRHQKRPGSSLDWFAIQGQSFLFAPLFYLSEVDCGGEKIWLEKPWKCLLAR
jgi:hypothetical protein